MLDTIKNSFSKVTVKLALAAAVVIVASLYLAWLQEGELSESLVEAIAEKPDYFAGVPQLLVAGVLWIVVWFLLNHPKLTLIGVIPLLLVWAIMLMTASDYGLDLGIGFFIYILALVVCVAMAFATKKTKKK